MLTINDRNVFDMTGPEYWGVINPEWSLCNRGRRQSPIDINPDQLLFDPTLEPLQFIGDLVSIHHVQYPLRMPSLSLFFRVSLTSCSHCDPFVRSTDRLKTQEEE